MTKVAIALLVLGALVLFVDHEHRLLADDIYCMIGAGELRQNQPTTRPPGNPVPDEYCLHGSVWHAIKNAITRPTPKDPPG